MIDNLSDKLRLEIDHLGELHSQLIRQDNILRIIGKLNKSNPFNVSNSSAFIDRLPRSKGLYTFYAQFDFKDHHSLIEFGSRWGNKNDRNSPSNLPRFHKNNAKYKTNIELLSAGEYLPFYLGKSEAIRDRVESHIRTGLDKTVYALKLITRPEVIKNVNFRLGYVEFDINNKSYFCVELLEKAVRSVIRPIIGK